MSTADPNGGGALVIPGPPLPLASGANEIPVSTGAGRVYAAQSLATILGGGVPWDAATMPELLTTTDAVAATLLSVDLDGYGGGMISAVVSAHNTAKTIACGWRITASATNAGGTVTIVDSVSEPTDPVSTLTCEFDVSGTIVRVRVTGVASGGDPDLEVNWCGAASALLHGSA